MPKASSLITNIASMVSIRLLQQALPLITLPYLARVLDATGFGLVAIATAYATFHQLSVDYGFDLSASRAVAQRRKDDLAVERIIRETLTAKLLLLAAASAIAMLIGWALPVFDGHLVLFAGAIALSGSQSLSLNWYFQGIERLQAFAALEGTARITGALGILVFVNNPGQYWLVPWVQVAPALLALFVSLGWMRQKHRVALASIKAGLASITGSWRIFAFKTSTALYTRMNVVILSLFVDPAIVGLYAAAEKVVQAAMSLTTPVAQVMLPRLSADVSNDEERARTLARRSFFILVVGATVGTALLIGLRLPVTETLFGSGFVGAAPLLAIMALAIPFGVGSSVLGVQWMLPLGLDGSFLRIIFLVGLANLVVAPIAALTFAAVGVTWTAVLAEAAVFTAIFVTLHGTGRNPLTRGASTRQP